METSSFSSVHITAESVFGSWRVVMYGVRKNGDPYVNSHSLRFSEPEAAIKAAKTWAHEEGVEYLDPIELYTKRAIYKFNQPLFLKKLHQTFKLYHRTGLVSLFSPCLPQNQRGQLLSRCGLTEAELAEFSIEICQVNSEACDDEHIKRYERGFEAMFGRKPEIHDFKVSAIGRDEFDAELKEKLRELKHCQFMWVNLAEALRGKQSMEIQRHRRVTQKQRKAALA
jgi:hypothetical protein